MLLHKTLVVGWLKSQLYLSRYVDANVSRTVIYLHMFAHYSIGPCQFCFFNQHLLLVRQLHFPFSIGYRHLFI